MNDKTSDVGAWLEFNRVASQADLEFSIDTTSALFWHETNGGIRTPRNGSTSFINLGAKTFAVTAAHVIDGWRESRDKAGARNAYVAGKKGALKLGNLEELLIDEDREMDLATFEITEAEVSQLGKIVVYGGQDNWPPPPPRVDQGLYFAGYPGVGTYVDATGTVFSAAAHGLAVSGLNDTEVLCQIERDKITGILGEGVPPENFNFGGISGAAMFVRGVQRGGILCWVFAGVVIQGPNTDTSDGSEYISGFELIRGRRSHFINADGTLDRDLWGHTTFTGR